MKKEGLDLFISLFESILENRYIRPIFKGEDYNSKPKQLADEDTENQPLKDSGQQSNSSNGTGQFYVATSIVNEEFFSLSWLQDFGQSISNLSPSVFVHSLAQSIIGKFALGRIE